MHNIQNDGLIYLGGPTPGISNEQVAYLGYSRWLRRFYHAVMQDIVGIARSACTAPHVALAMGNNQDIPRRQHGP
jgi:hypothetical protein